MFRRRRFGELIELQLRVFAEDNAERLAAMGAALEGYRSADRDDAEERFGDYADQIDWAAEELAELRDAYAATMEPELVEQYEREFSRAVRRAHPAIAPALDAMS
jgi:hypothetical protein